MADSKPRFAAGTSVTVERSQIEIKELLRKYGVDVNDHFFSGVREGNIFVTFRVDGYFYRLELPLLKIDDPRFARYNQRAAKDHEKQLMLDQYTREQWRALVLIAKGLVVSIDAGRSFREAFVGQLLLPNNTTVQQTIPTAIESIYKTGKAPEGVLSLPPHNPKPQTEE